VDPGEADLLVKARGGNVFAFEEVVRRYQQRVYATALRIVRRHEVADDVTQEAFLRGYQALDRFEIGRPFGPWICRIAANLAVNHVRSPIAREEPLPEGHGETPAESPDPLQGVLDEEARTVLQTALADLPAEQRAVFALRVFEELSYKEIARIADIPVGTVMSRLARARSLLRRSPLLHSIRGRTSGGEQ